MINDTLARLAKQRKDSISSDSVDKMIEHAKSMRPKPFVREPDYPDMPPRAQADATNVARRNK